MTEPILYEARDGVAWITLNRPEVRNAQNVALLMALDDAFSRAMDDDAVGCVVLGGAGKHFSAGHDIGTPERDIHLPFGRRATQYYPHADKPPTEATYVREAEAYVGLCRRWRELPKPTVCMVQGACVAGGLMLAWVCDLIIAADDAFFADPVLAMGIPGVEWFAHAHVMSPRQAKAFLFLGERMPAAEAHRVGMVHKVVAADALHDEVAAIAHRLAGQPRFAMALAKKAINMAEDRMGLRDTVDATYGMHHLAHAHMAATSADHIGGMDPKSMKASMDRKG
ncbi:MAG: enoyl-CoA hydratase [Alphaproteobacteria bacterium]|nr:enoyl-CoA hydratase [Alphaproteobacteria bacterium]